MADLEADCQAGLKIPMCTSEQTMGMFNALFQVSVIVPSLISSTEQTQKTVTTNSFTSSIRDPSIGPEEGRERSPCSHGGGVRRTSGLAWGHCNLKPAFPPHCSSRVPTVHPAAPWLLVW